MADVYRFLHKGHDGYVDPSDGPGLVTEEQATSPIIRTFIRKYGGDKDVDVGPPRVDEQLDFANSIKTWTDDELISQIKLHKEEWRKKTRSMQA
jgi:hypothetical protein